MKLFHPDIWEFCHENNYKMLQNTYQHRYRNYTFRTLIKLKRTLSYQRKFLNTYVRHVKKTTHSTHKGPSTQYTSAYVTTTSPAHPYVKAIS